MSEILEERKRRCQWLLEHGYTCDVEKGLVFNPKNIEIGTYISCRGYKVIKMPRTFDKISKSIYTHQFIFYYQYKEVVDVIDHIDGEPLNNSINNLRSASPQENSYNMRKSIGVYLDKRCQRWSVEIRINKKKYYLGCFNKDDYHLAIATYQKAKELRDSKQVDNSITPLEFRNLIKQKRGLNIDLFKL
jgi:spore coat polysaccharide biosynthesis protein SpsF (cytidylyltransferase family)